MPWALAFLCRGRLFLLGSYLSETLPYSDKITFTHYLQHIKLSLPQNYYLCSVFSTPALLPTNTNALLYLYGLKASQLRVWLIDYLC